jgi:hypothetical protein
LNITQTIKRGDARQIGLSIEDNKNQLHFPVTIEGVGNFVLPVIVDPWGDYRSALSGEGFLSPPLNYEFTLHEHSADFYPPLI